MDLNEIWKILKKGDIFWHKHALKRMMQRGISRKAVKEAILHGEVIEEYPEDHPFPSCLIFSDLSGPLHIVVAHDSANKLIYLITAYEPDLEHFEDDLKTRKTS